MSPFLRFEVFTLFPDVFAPYLETSILARAIDNGLVQVDLHNIRDWAADRHHITDDMPYGGGGGMVMRVTFAKTTYQPPPHRFEAGTPFIEGAVALAAAIDYVNRLGRPAIAAWEEELLLLLTERLSEIPEVRILGTAPRKAAVISFMLDGIHPHDVGTILDREGIAVRAGHHCAQPVMDRFGVPATTRASFGSAVVLRVVGSSIVLPAPFISATPVPWQVVPSRSVATMLASGQGPGLASLTGRCHAVQSDGDGKCVPARTVFQPATP